MAGVTDRLDGFTDAAFAFALTLLVIGRGGVPENLDGLAAAMAELPAFAIGFAIIGMFWFTHVRWRRYRGEGDWVSVLLTFILIFLVLVYVRPLQAMALSLSAVLGAPGLRFHGDVGSLFTIYGAGFAAMAAVVTGLFAEARRNPALGPDGRRQLRGEIVIWSILTATGLLSMLLSLFDATERAAPWPYATLPITIGLFAALYDWDGKKTRAADPAPELAGAAE
ncbi:MAG: TMEM175 family protein [Allosphingosinicella sp.]|uniref:TMEM175 family protein n=1 Tax=Allosphingosinicella sp. TaxID=2823234 RepID=UPI003951BF70